MRRVALVTLGCGLLLVLAIFGGCSTFDADMGPENLYPETTLSSASGNAVPGSTVRLNWFGWDPDGHVVGFDIRTAADSLIGDWSTVVCTDSVFLLSPDLTSSWAFWVRAVDNEGAVDPTPDSVAFVFRGE